METLALRAFSIVVVEKLGEASALDIVTATEKLHCLTTYTYGTLATTICAQLSILVIVM